MLMFISVIQAALGSVAVMKTPMGF